MTNSDAKHITGNPGNYLPRGRGFGGSHLINAMLYIRGHRWDYDHWAKLGNEGWGYNDVLDYFKKSENNQVFKDKYHGNEGPLNVIDPIWTDWSSDEYLDTAEKMGYKRSKDFNGDEQEGFAKF
jgi:choline dehydrogenase